MSIKPVAKFLKILVIVKEVAITASARLFQIIRHVSGTIFSKIYSGKHKILKLILTILILIIGLSSIVQYFVLRDKNPTDELAKSQADNNTIEESSIELLKIEGKNLIEELDILGQIVFYEKISISSKVNGRLHRLYVQEGKKLRKGELIAEIERLPLELQLKEQLAELDIASRSYDLSKAKYENAIKAIEIKFKTIEKAKADIKDKEMTYKTMDRTLKNKTVLFQSGGLSESDLEAIKAQHTSLYTKYLQAKTDLEIQEVGFRDQDIISEGIKLPKREEDKVKIFQAINTKIEMAEMEAAKSKIRQVEKGVESTRVLLRETYIYSPIDGVVATKNMEAGEMVKPESIITTLMTISKVFLAFNVNEKDTVKIKMGQEVVFEVDALKSETFKAKIERITPLLDMKTRTIEIKAITNNPGNRLLPGMFARARIMTGKKTNAIGIPIASLVKKDGKNGEVYLVKKGIAFLQKVTLGDEYKSEIEVVAGIERGDTIVAKGVNLVYPQMKIEEKRKLLK
jgi:RND family efflux transporter MFP subunit